MRKGSPGGGPRGASGPVLGATSPAASAVGMLWLLKGVTPSRPPMSPAPAPTLSRGLVPWVGVGPGCGAPWGPRHLPPSCSIPHRPHKERRPAEGKAWVTIRG